MMEDQDEGAGVAEEEEEGEGEVVLLSVRSVPEEEVRLFKLVLIASNVAYEIALGLRV
jgi:hypothetical protein